MAQSCFIAALLAALAHYAIAVPQSIAKRTAPADSHNLLGWSPLPTQAVKYDSFDLFKRNSGQICGYYRGTSSVIVGCGGSYVCAQDSLLPVLGCCDPNNLQACIIPTACLGLEEVATACDSGCLADRRIGKCTSSTFTQCAIDVLVNGRSTVTAFACDLVGGFSSPYYITYSGDPTPGPGPIHITATPVPSSTTPTSTTIHSTSPTPTVTNTNTPKPSPTPVGAIAGGVVGGLAVIVLGIVAVIWIKRKNRKNNTDNNQNNVTTSTDTQGPGPSPPYGVAGDGYAGYNDQKPGMGAQYPSGVGTVPVNYNSYNPSEFEGSSPPLQSHLQPDPMKTATLQPISPVSAHSPMSSTAVPSHQTSPVVNPIQPVSGTYRPPTELAGSAGFELHELPAQYRPTSTPGAT